MKDGVTVLMASSAAGNRRRSHLSGARSLAPAKREGMRARKFPKWESRKPVLPEDKRYTALFALT